MATSQLLYLNQYFTTSLNVGGGIDNTQTTGIICTDVTGVDTAKPGKALLSYTDPLNIDNAEWIEYTSINGSKEFVGVTRGSSGYSAKAHNNGVVIAFPLDEDHINRLAAMFDSVGLDVAQIATPASPSSARNKLYFKTDGYPYQLNSSGVETALVNENGWLPANGTWTYASATTITVPSGAASKYRKGDRIRITQTTDKYFYVIGVADTLLTVTGGTEYTVANAAITNPLFSHGEPVDMPGYFSFTQSSWATSGTAFTNAPTTYLGRFYIQGNKCWIWYIFLTNATSGGTGIFRVTLTANLIPNRVDMSCGNALNVSSTANTGIIYISNTNEFSIQKYDATAIAGNNAYVTCSMWYMF